MSLAQSLVPLSLYTCSLENGIDLDCVKVNDERVEREQYTRRPEWRATHRVKTSVASPAIPSIIRSVMGKTYHLMKGTRISLYPLTRPFRPPYPSSQWHLGNRILKKRTNLFEIGRDC